MTIDLRLTEQARAALDGARNVRELKMFGGICFMLNGNMLVGASDRGLLVRVGEQNQDRALTYPGTRLMEMKGRPFPGYVQVAPEELDARSVKRWVKLARSYVDTLPAKVKKPVKKKAMKGKAR